MQASLRILANVLVLATTLGLSATAAPPPTDKDILTPKPGPAPHINGPKVYGCRPGHEFLYRIPCTGTRPIEFGATGLPDSLKLDPFTGIIRGKAPTTAGTYAVSLSATNAAGRVIDRPFKIVVGDTLALTPPMGWNDWYTWTDRITDVRMRSAADILISTGMADFGYNYVNIDDCWMVKPGATGELGGPIRDAQGAIRPNQRFPDMPALTAYIHSKGLKAGLYTGPGPTTCAGFAASWQHEEIDAKTFAAWGFDFLKYDWCSYTSVAGGNDRVHQVKPYKLMGGLVAKLDRDVVFNLCQYGMSNVWEWAGDIGGQCWRTTGDVGMEKGERLPGFYRVGFSNAKHARYAGPGRWNDPDYLLIGVVGTGHCGLNADEEYVYMSMWSLMAAPLFYSGDMEKLDAFTLNVLCNAEVIDVNQDVLGKQARIVRQDESDLVLAKPLEDGSLAVGIFNLGEEPRDIAVTNKELGVTGTHKVRDLWRQKDTGTVQDSYSARVNRHGVTMVRLTP